MFDDLPDSASAADLDDDALVAGIEDWCEEMGRLTGLTPEFAPTESTIAAIIPDLTKLHSTGFKGEVGWREGIRRLVTTSRPDLLK